MYVAFSATVIILTFFVRCNCDIDLFFNEAFTTTKIGPKPLWSETTLDKLKKDLLMNYDKYSRPEQHYNSTDVQVGFGLTHVETNELKSTATFHGWLRLVWLDSKLKWNESDYGGLPVARLADHEIWQPDLYLYNSATGGEPVTKFGNPNVLLYPNGEVLFVPPVKLTVLCEFNLRHWPYDTQLCFFKFGSWTHNGYEIKLKLYSNKSHVDLETSLSWSAWSVTNSTAEAVLKFYDCCPEPYYYAQFNVTLVRKSTPYKTVIITPAIVIASLILMQFWLPPQAEERLILNSFLIITVIIFLLYFTSQVGTSGSATPLIILFYSGSLYMICFSMAASAAVIALSKLQHTQSLVWLIKKNVQGKVGKFFLLEYTFEVSTTTSQSLQQHKSKISELTVGGSFGETHALATTARPGISKKQDWEVALVLDRILFLMYGIALVVSSTMYLL